MNHIKLITIPILIVLFNACVPPTPKVLVQPVMTMSSISVYEFKNYTSLPDIGERLTFHVEKLLRENSVGKYTVMDINSNPQYIILGTAKNYKPNPQWKQSSSSDKTENFFHLTYHGEIDIDIQVIKATIFDVNKYNFDDYTSNDYVLEKNITNRAKVKPYDSISTKYHKSREAIKRAMKSKEKDNLKKLDDKIIESTAYQIAKMFFEHYE